MESKVLIGQSIRTALSITNPLLDDLAGDPLVHPTPAGGNHAMWCAGHMAQGAGHLIWEVMQGIPNPVAGWDEMFGGGSQPHSDASRYPAYETVLERFRSIHEEALELLDSMTEEQLDQPSANIPDGFESFFGTYRQCFSALAIHMANHRGQLTDCRRTLGRDPLLA